MPEIKLTLCAMPGGVPFELHVYATEESVNGDVRVYRVTRTQKESTGWHPFPKPPFFVKEHEYARREAVLQNYLCGFASGFVHPVYVRSCVYRVHKNGDCTPVKITTPMRMKPGHERKRVRERDKRKMLVRYAHVFTSLKRAIHELADMEDDDFDFDRTQNVFFTSDDSFLLHDFDVEARFVTLDDLYSDRSYGGGDSSDSSDGGVQVLSKTTST